MNEIVKRLRRSCVEDYELDPGVCKDAADEIERLRQWIRDEGERKDSTRSRDGVWISNGLSADFRHLYVHPHYPYVHRVQTASGEHYAHETELKWDCKPRD